MGLDVEDLSRGYDDAVTMIPRYITEVELEGIRVSALTRLRNMVHGISLTWRKLLFTVPTACTGG